MFKLIALFAVIVCSSAQLLRINPLILGSNQAAALQTIQLQAGGPRLAYARPQAVAYRAAAPVAIAAPAAYSAPIISRAVLADESPEPYTYAFESTDEFGTVLSRSESADGNGAVTGSYSLAEADGRQRIVQYVADAAGYRATVRTNEPGTANANPADVLIQSTAPTRR